MQLGLYRTNLTAAARIFIELRAPRLGKMINRCAGSRADGNSVNSSNNFLSSSTNYEEEFPPLSANKNYVQRKRRIDLAPCSKQKLESVQNISPLQHEASNLSTSPKQESKVALNIGPLQCEASTSVSDHYDTDLHTGFGKKKSLSSCKNLKFQHEASNLSTCSEQESKVALNIDPLQCETSTSISDLYDTDLPTNFGKKLKVAPNFGPLQCDFTSISDHYDTDLPTSFGKKKSSSSFKNQKFHRTRQEYQEAKKRSKPSSVTPIDEPFDICPPETTESTSPWSYVNQRNRGIWVPKEDSAEDNEQNKCDAEKGNNTEDLYEEPGLLLRPGMVLFKHYIPLSEQMNIVNRCRDLGCGPGGFYRPGYNDGAKLRLYMMCLGLDWNPQTKSYRKKRQHDNVLPPELPHEFTSLVCRVLDDSHTLIKRDMKVRNVEDVLPTMHPDVCIVNFYSTNGRLGLHQDRDESQESLDKGLPVVSISIGDSAEFLYGDVRDVNKAESVLLESGDVLIFGGEARHIYHGVKTIISDSAPSPLLESTKLRPGRLNLTFRKY